MEHMLSPGGAPPALAATTPPLASWNPFDEYDPFADVGASSALLHMPDDPFGVNPPPASEPARTGSSSSSRLGRTDSSEAASKLTGRLGRTSSSTQTHEDAEETLRMLRRDSSSMEPGALSPRLSAAQPVKPGNNSSPHSPSPARLRPHTSSDHNNPFADEPEPGGASSRTRRETMANSDSNESEEEEAGEPSATAAGAVPIIPPRPRFAAEMVARAMALNDNSKVFVDEAATMAFLNAPLEKGRSLTFGVTYDPHYKIFRMELLDQSRLLLLAHKRTDGLKALSFAANYSICMPPSTNGKSSAYAEQMRQLGHKDGLDAMRVAKLRGNIAGSVFTLYDQGKNPSKAMGALDARRELASIRFAILPSIYTRRATYVCVPLPGAAVRPLNTADTLVERAKKGDKSVLALNPLLPHAPRLPRVEDYRGIADKHSIKNMMLHDPATKEVILVLGKASQYSFRLCATFPFSPVQAFACALASFESSVMPQRQL